MPASTDSASIVRMMKRDGMRMKFRPGSQCTYRHNSNGQDDEHQRRHHRDQQIEAPRSCRAAAGAAGQLTIAIAASTSTRMPGKQIGVGFVREGPQNRALQELVEARRRGEKALDARLRVRQVTAPQARFRLARCDRAA